MRHLFTSVGGPRRVGSLISLLAALVSWYDLNLEFDLASGHVRWSRTFARRATPYPGAMPEPAGKVSERWAPR